MGTNSSLLSFFTRAFSIFPAPFSKEAFLTPLYVFGSIVKNYWPIYLTCGYISGLLILSHCMCLSHHPTPLPPGQNHSVLIIIALKYNLNSGNMTSEALFFFLRTDFYIWGLFWFHTNLMFCFFSSISF